MSNGASPSEITSENARCAEGTTYILPGSWYLVPGMYFIRPTFVGFGVRKLSRKAALRVLPYE